MALGEGSWKKIDHLYFIIAFQIVSLLLFVSSHFFWGYMYHGVILMNPINYVNITFYFGLYCQITVILWLIYDSIKKLKV